MDRGYGRPQGASSSAETWGAVSPLRRIIAVTEAKVIGGTTATFDTLAEFDRASGVRTVFGLFRSSKANPWKLRSFKIVLPMPRAADEPAKPPPVVVPPVTPHRDAGVH